MHPTHVELRRFVTGRLDESAAEIIGRHLETCAPCETLAAEVDAGEDELLACLSSVPSAEDSAARQLNQAARQFAARLGRLPLASPAWTAGPPPAQFGEYRLGPLLGRGGMGLVFRAHHRTLDRAVAVKFLPPRPDAVTRGRERFLHEARAMAKLRHSRLVSALDAGCEGAWTYVVMELLEGIDFERLSRRASPLRVEDACELVRQAAEGLAALHAHGLVHRDLKPSNLMLVAQPSGPPAVKILDLGLSRWLPAEGSDPSDIERLTVEGQWLGTLDYVAPEQLRDVRRTRPSADLYALGATLHGLLTGVSIWSSDHGDPLPTRIARRLTDRPGLAWDVRPDLPRDLIRLTEELLSGDPAQRPTTEQVIARLTPWSARSDLASLYRLATEAVDATRDQDREEEPGATRLETKSPPLMTPASRGASMRPWIAVGMLVACVAAGLLARQAILSGKSRYKAEDPSAPAVTQRVAPPDGDQIVRRAANRAAAPTKGDRRAAILDLLAHGGALEFDGLDGVITAPGSLPEEIPAVRNLTIRGREWPELNGPELLGLLARVGPVRNGLWLEAIEVNADDLTRVGRLESLVDLRILVVGDCSLADPGDLAPFRQLRQAGFPRTNLSDQGVRRLAALPNVRILDVAETQITDDGLLALAGLPYRQLVLRGNARLTDRSLTRLAANKELESLTLSGTGVTDGTLEQFAGHPCLNGLYLADTPITDKGLDAIVRIPRLNYLALNDTRVTAHGVLKLAALPLHDLWLNDLRCVDDDVLWRIAEIRTLKNLSLTRTAITDRGIQELRRLPELRLLFLTGTHLSDDAVASLAECRQLRTVFLVDTPITPPACGRLRELLPNCEVVYP